LVKMAMQGVRGGKWVSERRGERNWMVPYHLIIEGGSGGDGREGEGGEVAGWGEQGQGVSEQVIRIVGGWLSEALERYVSGVMAAAEGVGEVMRRSRVDEVLWVREEGGGQG
jgi:hypothetical protein